MKLIIASILILSLVNTSCKVFKKRDTSEKPVVEVVDWQHVYDGWTCEERDSCRVYTKIKRPSVELPQQVMQIAVLDLRSQNVVYEGVYNNAHLEWVAPSVFKIHYVPGNPEMGKEYFLFYNLKTLKVEEQHSNNKK